MRFYCGAGGDSDGAAVEAGGGDTVTGAGAGVAVTGAGAVTAAGAVD